MEPRKFLSFVLPIACLWALYVLATTGIVPFQAAFLAVKTARDSSSMIYSEVKGMTDPFYELGLPMLPVFRSLLQLSTGANSIVQQLTKEGNSRNMARLVNFGRLLELAAIVCDILLTILLAFTIFGLLSSFFRERSRREFPRPRFLWFDQDPQQPGPGGPQDPGNDNVLPDQGNPPPAQPDPLRVLIGRYMMRQATLNSQNGRLSLGGLQGGSILKSEKGKGPSKVGKKPQRQATLRAFFGLPIPAGTAPGTNESASPNGQDEADWMDVGNQGVPSSGGSPSGGPSSGGSSSGGPSSGSSIT